MADPKDDELIRASLEMRYSVRMIARTLGVSPRRVERVRDGRPRGRPGPKPASRQKRRPRPPAPVGEASSRLDRAVAHYLKNQEDMSVAEVADMYGLDPSSLHSRLSRERKG